MNTMGGPAPPYPRGGQPGSQSQVPQFPQVKQVLIKDGFEHI